jgi:hypothetical protein
MGGACSTHERYKQCLLYLSRDISREETAAQFWEELSPTFLDTTRTTLKTTHPTILLLLRLYSLQR